MPYVTVIKDFSNVQPKVVPGLTKRHLITVVVVAVTCLPTYFLLYRQIGITYTGALICAISIPFFLWGLYPIYDGRPIEKRIANYIKARYLRPAKRPYSTTTIYLQLETAAKIKEVIDDAEQHDYAKKAKTPKNGKTH